MKVLRRRPNRGGGIHMDLTRTLSKRAARAPFSINRDVLLLIALIAGVTFLNVLWSWLDTRPPQWDMGAHLQKSLLYSWYLTTLNLWEFVTAYSFYPPLVYWVTVPFYVVFGSSINIAVTSIDVVFLSVLIFSVYGIGTYLWSRRVGLLSALAITCTPYVATMGKEYTLDVPLTAMAALGLYLLLRAEGFTNRTYSLCFGAAFGLGMLTKWTYPLLFLAPLLLAAGRIVLSLYREKDWTPLQNAVLAGLISFFVCGYWYVGHFRAFLSDFERFNVPMQEIEGEPAVGTAASNLYYLYGLLNEQLYLIPVLLLITGLGILAIKRDALARNADLLVYCVGIYIAFSLLANKNVRYSLPILVGIIPLCLYWFDLIPSKRIRGLISAAVVCYSLAIFILVSFGSFSLPREVSFNVAGMFPLTVYSEQGHVSGPPSDERWHMEDMVQAVVNDPANPKTLSYSGPDTIWFNSESLKYYSTLYGVEYFYKVKFLSGSYGVNFPDKDSRYVAVRSNEEVEPEGDLTSLKRYTLPDESHLILYRRDPS
jgi:4-amino-4-deoxy-L-arabinose transferase-like glycosyltransferase